jgi:hypothetical protein
VHLTLVRYNRHVDRRQRPTPLTSRKAKSRHQPQLGVDGLDVAHAGEP